MEILKNFRSVILIVFAVLVLVIIRSAGVNHFKSDARRRAEPTFTKANIITPEQFKNLPCNKLTINLDKKMLPGYEMAGDLLNISADSILIKNSVKSILRHKGPVLIYSSQPDLAARIWMIFSQMGCREIYILTNSTDNEVLQYEFRPDTIISRLES